MPRLFRKNEDATIGYVIDTYLDHLLARHVKGKFSKKGLQNNRTYLRSFRDFMGSHMYVSECRQRDIGEWVAKNPNWKSRHTLGSAVGHVVTCFRWAHEEELIDRIPYTAPSSIREVVAKPRRPATEAEFTALMKSVPAIMKKPLWWLRMTGARTCEMRDLKWCNVHFDAETPHIWLDRHKTASKTGKARIIVLTPMMAKFMRRMWMKRDARKEHVFLNSRRRPWTCTAFAKLLRSVIIRHNLPTDLSAYCLRHSYACQGVKSGLTLKEVADQLGNTAAIVERVYASFTGQDMAYLAKNAAKIEKGRRG